MKRNIWLMMAWFATVVYFGVTLFNLEQSVEYYATLPEWRITILLSMFVPHLVLIGAGIVINFLAWLRNKRLLALISGIVYVTSLAFMPYFLEQMALQIALCFIAYATMKPTLKPT